MKPEAGLLCRRWMYSGRWRSPGYAAVYVCSITSIQTTYSHHWRLQRHSTLQSTLSQHQSSRAWRCRGVSSSLTRYTLFDSCCKHTVPNDPWWHSRCNMCLLPWMMFGRPPLFAQCVDIDRRLYYSTIQNLWSRVLECPTDHCWKQRHTIEKLCPTCAAIRRYVHPASLRPTMQHRSNGWSCSTGVRTCRRGMVVP